MPHMQLVLEQDLCAVGSADARHWGVPIEVINGRECFNNDSFKITALKCIFNGKL